MKYRLLQIVFILCFASESLGRLYGDVELKFNKKWKDYISDRLTVATPVNIDLKLAVFINEDGIQTT